MNELQMKEIIELHIKERLNVILKDKCINKNKYTESDYIFQDSKLDFMTIKETGNTIFNIEDIDFENGIITVNNKDNLQYPLTNKKIFVNYEYYLEVSNIKDNEITLLFKEDIHRLSIGDIITEKEETDRNKIFIMVDITNVMIENKALTSVADTQLFDVSIFVGCNDYSINKEKFIFFYDEVIRIFREQSFNIKYKEQELYIFSEIKPRYNSGVKTENDRIGYILLSFSYRNDYNKRI